MQNWCNNVVSHYDIGAKRDRTQLLMYWSSVNFSYIEKDTADFLITLCCIIV